MASGSRLTHHVRRAAATLRDSPLDILRWHLDRAALAMHAVLCVDHELLLGAIFGVIVGAVLVHTRRAKPLLGAIEHGQRQLDRLGGELRPDTEMRLRGVKGAP